MVNQMNAHNESQKNNKTRNIVIITVILILCCFVCGLIIIVLSFFGVFTTKEATISNGSQQPVVNTTNSSTNSTSTPVSNEPEAPATKVFVGTYVIATIPSDWTIKEYSDKNGMSGYADTGSVSFSGLTGLEIIDENSNVVFSFKGIDGIGGAGGCTTLTKFPDTDSTYIQNVKDETDMLGFDPTVVTSVPAGTYTEYTTLNERFRRVYNQMYVAKNFSQSFNTACGIEAQFIKLDELSFNVNDSGTSYSANAYKFSINPSVTDESTLQKLDDVMKTLKAKNIS